LHNVASCWLYLKEYINDARPHERQNKTYATAHKKIAEAIAKLQCNV